MPMIITFMKFAMVLLEVGKTRGMLSWKTISILAP